MIWTGNTFASSVPAASMVPIPLSIKSGDSLVVADVSEVEVLPRNISSRILTEVLPDTLPYLTFEPDMFQAMYEQASYLRRPDVKEKGASGINRKEMLKTVELLQRINLLDPSVLVSTFDFYEVNTDLKHDRVRMTGYYTPVIRASRTKTPEYSIPMLAKPGSNIPAPAAIEAGALSGRGLELAWLPSKKRPQKCPVAG